MGDETAARAPQLADVDEVGRPQRAAAPEPEVSIAGQYFRSRDGKVVHWSPCSVMGDAVPWSYAERLSLHAVVRIVHGTEWLRLCRSCWPAAALEVSGG